MSNQNNGNDDSKWINNVGILATGKDKPDGTKGKPYIEIKQDIVLKAGDRLTMKKKEDSLREALEAGRMTQAKFDEMMDKTGWIKYELTRAPRTPKK
jgi:hypothetical protein